MESTYCTNVSVHPMQLPYCAQLRQSWDPSLCWFVGESHIFTWAPSLSHIVQKYLCLPMYILAQLCDLRLCVCVCVFCSHGNSTTYQRPRNRTGAKGIARVLPKHNPCQGWHERRERQEGGDGSAAHACAHTHTHTTLSAHTLDILLFFLAGDSHGNSNRNPFSTDARTAVQILNETQLVWPFLHAAWDKNYMVLNSNLYSLLPKYIQFIQSLSSPSHSVLNST